MLSKLSGRSHGRNVTAFHGESENDQTRTFHILNELSVDSENGHIINRVSFFFSTEPSS